MRYTVLVSSAKNATAGHEFYRPVALESRISTTTLLPFPTWETWTNLRTDRITDRNTRCDLMRRGDQKEVVFLKNKLLIYHKHRCRCRQLALARASWLKISDENIYGMWPCLRKICKSCSKTFKLLKIRRMPLQLEACISNIHGTERRRALDSCMLWHWVLRCCATKKVISLSDRCAFEK